VGRVSATLPCDSCGAMRALTEVAAIKRRTGERTTLRLCRICLIGPSRAWKRLYAEVEDR
jgi:hypothetical protein